MVTSPRASERGFPTLPPVYDFENDTDALRFIWSQMQLLSAGKMNITGEVTFTVSATTTTVLDARVGKDSVILFMPLSETAAGELGYWVSSQGKQTFTVTHGFDTRTRTFRYVILG